MKISVTDRISLREIELNDSINIYQTIDSQCEYLGKWLPFVEFTQSVDFSKLFIQSILDAHPSRRIPIRLGFRFEGIERAGEFFADGSFVDLEVYSRLKDDQD